MSEQAKKQHGGARPGSGTKAKPLETVRSSTVRAMVEPSLADYVAASGNVSNRLRDLIIGDMRKHDPEKLPAHLRAQATESEDDQ